MDQNCLKTFVLVLLEPFETTDKYQIFISSKPRSLTDG